MALNQPNQFPLSPISLNTKTSTPAIAGQPSMGTIMGQRALSPLDNTKPVAQTLPQGQVQPPIQAQPKSDIQNQLDALKQTAMGLQNSLAQQPPTQLATPTAPTTSQGYGVNQGLYGQLITGLANAPQTNPDVAQARQNLQNLQNEYAQQTGNIEANRGGLSLQGGQEGLLNRLFATKQAAAQEALSSALTSQQLQQQALGAAAGLAQPQQYPITGLPYNPVTGQFGPIAGAAQGAGAGTSGIAGVGDVMGRLNLAQQLPQLGASYNQATGIKNSFENWLQNNKSTLSSDVNLVNGLKSWAMGGQFSDPRYPELNQFLNEYLNTITPLIGASGNVTDFKQGIVQNMINPTSSADSIVQQINNLHNIAGGKLQEFSKSVNTPFNPSTIQTGGQPTGGNTFGTFNAKPQ